MRFSKLLVSSISTFALAACITADENEVSGEAGHPGGAAGAPSTRGITPVPYYGNFSTVDDDQICYELSQLGGWDVTSEMRGIKIDPPVSSTSFAASVTVTQPYLAWRTLAGWEMLAVVVKGGPNFNLYDYGPDNGFDSDGRLHSPVYRKNLPAISHYNYCVQPTEPPSNPGGEGCTPGYWRNHADRWLGATPSDRYNLTFDITSGLGETFTLGQAIWANGGGESALARHATAGLLNSFGGIPNDDGEVVNYPYTTTQVKSIVQNAYGTTDDPLTPVNERANAIEAAKNQLASANELGCPLGGTRANPVE